MVWNCRSRKWRGIIMETGCVMKCKQIKSQIKSYLIWLRADFPQRDFCGVAGSFLLHYLNRIWALGRCCQVSQRNVHLSTSMSFQGWVLRVFAEAAGHAHQTKYQGRWSLLGWEWEEKEPVSWHLTPRIWHCLCPWRKRFKILFFGFKWISYLGSIIHFPPVCWEIAVMNLSITCRGGWEQHCTSLALHALIACQVFKVTEASWKREKDKSQETPKIPKSRWTRSRSDKTQQRKCSLFHGQKENTQLFLQESEATNRGCSNCN